MFVLLKMQDVRLRYRLFAAPLCRFNAGRQAAGELGAKERLELSRHKTLEPKSSASTNSATSAQNAGKTVTGLPTRRAILS